MKVFIEVYILIIEVYSLSYTLVVNCCNVHVLYICILSNKFDLKQTIRVLHTGGQRFDGPRSVTKYDGK